MCSRTKHHRMYPAKRSTQNMYKLQKILCHILTRMSPLPKEKAPSTQKETQFTEKAPTRDSINFPQLQTTYTPTALTMQTSQQVNHVKSPQ
ncbi:hypothetical protein CEXT_605131 [Caerostris extrusa]|uniref:Uncharacterized protein n=1 Tax=Caerostris extrusa TaxID=172846 RepID=A0AAV4UCX4_CAEEX|nr:hypothetical protein CEXT_605131 [Caerostris extrusa]